VNARRLRSKGMKMVTWSMVLAGATNSVKQALKREEKYTDVTKTWNRNDVISRI